LDSSEAEDEDAIGLDDRIDAMCDDDHGGIHERRIYKSLDLLLRDNINVSRRLVENDELGLPQDGPAYAD